MLGKASFFLGGGGLKRHKSSSMCEQSISAVVPGCFIFASRLSRSFPHLSGCTCKTAPTPPANSPPFEEALILVSPPLGRQTVPASILVSHRRTQISMPVKTLSYIHLLYEKLDAACRTKEPLSGPLPMFENTKMVFVLLRKWCRASWGAVSFGWVVLVWPLRGSPRPRRRSQWITGSVGVKHLFLIPGIMHHLWPLIHPPWICSWGTEIGGVASLNSRLHFRPPPPAYLKDASIWSWDQLRPKTTCYLLFGARGFMLERQS